MKDNIKKYTSKLVKECLSTYDLPYCEEGWEFDHMNEEEDLPRMIIRKKKGSEYKYSCISINLSRVDHYMFFQDLGFFDEDIIHEDVFRAMRYRKNKSIGKKAVTKFGVGTIVAISGRAVIKIDEFVGTESVVKVREDIFPDKFLHFFSAEYRVLEEGVLNFHNKKLRDSIEDLMDEKFVDDILITEVPLSIIHFIGNGESKYKIHIKDIVYEYKNKEFWWNDIKSLEIFLPQAFHFNSIEEYEGMVIKRIKNNKMEQVKIESDDKNVQITCPHCGNWEQIGVDEPRHRFESMPIHIWLEATEVSVHRCSECKNNFAVEWDYDNEFKNDLKNLIG